MRRHPLRPRPQPPPPPKTIIITSSAVVPPPRLHLTTGSSPPVTTETTTWQKGCVWLRKQQPGVVGSGYSRIAVVMVGASVVIGYVGISVAKSASDSRIAVVMVGASVVIGYVGISVEDWLSLESLIRESSILMETGSGEFHVRWEYPAKN
nr:hypothetical protein [Tanacetum cinerariifolium]